MAAAAVANIPPLMVKYDFITYGKTGLYYDRSIQITHEIIRKD